MNNENEPLTVTNGQSLPTEVAVKDEDLLKIKTKLTPEQLVQAQNYAVALKIHVKTQLPITVRKFKIKCRNLLTR